MSWSSQNICILIYKLLCILWAVFGWNVVQVYCTMQNSKIYLFKKSWWIKNPYFLLILNMLIDLTDSMYLFIFIFLLLLGLFAPPGHIDTLFPVWALYPEPRTRPYEIRIYRYRSLLRALTAGRFRPTRPQTVVGKVSMYWTKSKPKNWEKNLLLICLCL